MLAHSMAQLDSQGISYPTATAVGVDLYDKVVRQMSWFQASVFDTIEGAISANPEFAMPYFAKAYLNLYMTEPHFRDVASAAMAALRAAVDVCKLSWIEQAHLKAIESWIAGNLNNACALLDDIGREEPREILALRVGHEMDFFAGATRDLRDRVARQLPAWTKTDPHYGIVLGAYAFGLVENGHYDQAEVIGRQALSYGKQDAWALHAVAHSLEMRGLTGQGIRFMTDRVADWAENNLFAAHNWWHTALFHSDSGDAAAALNIYDDFIFNDKAMKVALVMLDASSLLWRLHLDGVDVTDRMKVLSDDWKSNLPPQPYYLFNDMHATMAHVAAGDLRAADHVVARIDQYLMAGDDQTNAYQIAGRVGGPICRAIVAYGKGHFNECVNILYDVRKRASGFGGSNAQRDVLDRTLLSAAMNGKLHSVARSISSERVTLKEYNPSSWRRYSEVLAMTGAATKDVEFANAHADHLTASAYLQSRKAPFISESARSIDR